MANVSFKLGTYAQYNGLSDKDTNALYFTTDTQQLFKGDVEYTKTTKLVPSLPETGQLQGVIYVNTTDWTAHIYNGEEYKALTKGYATTISDKADDTTVPTSKAVKDYVEKKIQDVQGGTGIFVTDVTYESGSLTVEKGQGDTTDVELTGVAHEPTYDAGTRTIKIPIYGKQELVIALGKDAVVSSGTYNSKSKELELTLTSGDTVKIPVNELVDVYTGENGTTVNVTVSDDKKISAEVNISQTANNALTKDDTGLFVEKIDAYTKTEIDGKLDPVTEHIEDDTKHVTDSDKTKWNAAEQNAKTYADGLNTTMDTRVKALETAKATLEGRVETVETALTWGTISE